MENFYLFTIVIAITFFFQKRLANVLLIIGCIFFLFYLPSVEYFSDDYFGYEDAFETGFSIAQFPWVASFARIDAEPFYLWYTAMVKVVSGQEYPFFLAVNFVLCLVISHFILKSFSSYFKQFFWVMFLPVLFPTMFYFLIRSSASFFMVALGFFSLLNSNKKKAIGFCLLFVYMGINLHSQYILLSLLFIGAFFVLKFESIKYYKFNIKFIVISAIILIGLLVSLKSFTEELSILLSVLPSSDIASTKVGYLVTEDSRGFRITSVLSILIYPFMMYQVLRKTYKTEQVFILNDKVKERKFLFLFFVIICYGASINIAYLDSPHLAGRLARFSDYLGMCLLLPMYFKVCIGNKLEYVMLAAITLLAPLLYGSIYAQVEWGIF